MAGANPVIRTTGDTGRTFAPSDKRKVAHAIPMVPLPTGAHGLASAPAGTVAR